MTRVCVSLSFRTDGSELSWLFSSLSLESAGCFLVPTRESVFNAEETNPHFQCLMLKHRLTSRLTWVPSRRAPRFLVTSASRKAKVWEMHKQIIPWSSPYTFLLLIHSFVQCMHLTHHPCALKRSVAHKLFPNSVAGGKLHSTSSLLSV